MTTAVKSIKLIELQKYLSINKAHPDLVSIENSRNSYDELIKAYKKVKKFSSIYTNELKVYFLLCAIKYKDVLLAQELIEKFDYESMSMPSAILGLARYYHQRGFYKKANKEYLKLFDEKVQIIQLTDYDDLLTDLQEMAQYKDVERVLHHLLNTYPNNLTFKIRALAYQLSIRHKFTVDQNHIKSNLIYLYDRCKSSAEYFAISLAFYQAGYIKDFIRTSNICLAKLSELQNEIKDSKKFIANECLKSMDEIIDDLQTLGYKPFPVFGSLLGLYRDGKLMDYDKDADIGLFLSDHNEIKKIILHICQKSYFVAPCMIKNTPSSHKFNVAIHDIKRGTAIDIFFHTPNADRTKIFTGIYTENSPILWEFSYFDLIPTHLAGRSYLAPANIEIYLSEVYGPEWRHPVEVWDSLVNCPNLPSSSSMAVYFFGFMRLYKSLVEKRAAKARNYYITLKDKWNFPFTEEANNNIIKLQSKINQG